MPPIDIQTAVHTAQAEGVLPDSVTTTHIKINERPWAVVLLSALGGWLVTIPILIFIALAVGFEDGTAAFLIWSMVLIGLSVTMLRMSELSIFVEQIAVSFLSTGLAALCIGLNSNDNTPLQCFVPALVCVSLACILPQAWLRWLLGAACAAFVLFGLNDLFSAGRYEYTHMTALLSLYSVLLLGLAVLAWQQQVLSKYSGIIESFNLGALLVVIAGFALWSGRSFLSDAFMDFGELANQIVTLTASIASVTLAVLASYVLLSQWQKLRSIRFIAIAAVTLGLAYVMPALGTLLALLAVFVVTQRNRMAAAAALAAVWVIGAFYYQLAWPLTSKAAVLAGAGALLAALTIPLKSAQRNLTSTHSDSQPNSLPPKRSTLVWGLGFSILATLLTVNVGIWQKEQLIAHGKVVFVELAPVDPRSLMQGDYMQLNFDILNQLRTDTFDAEQLDSVVLKLDANGIASIADKPHNPLAPDEIAVQLKSKEGRLMLVTDAFYFKEGTGERWSQAKFGEFRIDEQGKALLVGLRGANLNPL